MSYNVFEIFTLKKYFMKIVYLWFYTLFLVMIWWFFIVAKIHAYKFKNFSNYIEKVTQFLLILLIILSLSWYVLIFLLDDNIVNNLKFDNKDLYFNEVNY